MQHAHSFARRRVGQQYAPMVPRTRREAKRNTRKAVVLGEARVASVTSGAAGAAARRNRLEQDRDLLNWSLVVLRKLFLVNLCSATRPTISRGVNDTCMRGPETSYSFIRRPSELPMTAGTSCSRHERAYLTGSIGNGRRLFSTPAAPKGGDDEFTLPCIHPRVHVARADVVRRVNSVLQTSFGTRYKVEVFGSTCYGTDTLDSDLDLVLLDSKAPRGLDPAIIRDNVGPYDINAVAVTLRRATSMIRSATPMFTDITTIPKANVPIVKFQDTATGLSCDLNVNDRLAVANTALIKRYCELFPLLRPMLYVVKFWARRLGLNDPSAIPATPSSYAYAMMTISFLQTRGLLPNLQEGHDGVWPDDDHCLWFRKITHQKKNEVLAKCDPRFSQYEGWQPGLSIPSLREALIDWFSYWALEHDYPNLAASIRDGGMIARTVIAERHSPDNERYAELLSSRDALQFGLPTGHTLPKMPELGTRPELECILNPPFCVHDPFIRLKNLTVSTSKQTVSRIKDECQAASKSLKEGLPIAQLCEYVPRTQSVIGRGYGRSR
ncbi:hypothetical protein DAEQUDRAFT_178145 [Daedalea quercina L-15889]|uniref:Poly(A) RNA polymerase mitochondrial-like central palm domain-containing protein n=1 Tax=Daedalea quercina L-15889 TaxID=1314783 RepID=A0A165RDN2_9APHY|nr:hypothetical protein DAEQUDRAFT_178145 [Daedalea quercina L-15889]